MRMIAATALAEEKASEIKIAIIASGQGPAVCAIKNEQGILLREVAAATIMFCFGVYVSGRNCLLHRRFYGVLAFLPLPETSRRFAEMALKRTTKT